MSMSVASIDRIVEGIQPARLSLDPAMFAENFDKRGFHLEHQLVGHPLLELLAIAALSQRLPANLLEWNAEQDGAFTEPNKLRPHHLSCADTILNLERQPARVLLLSIENDPPYRKLMDELLDQMEPLTQRSHPGMSQRQAFIFLSSKAAYTPFHFDPDYNFLLQIRGQKTIFMWDPLDRNVLPASAIDSYYAGAGSNPSYANRHQKYRDEFMQRRGVFPCAPGRAFTSPFMRRTRS
jgi:hypothetical protein